jgi:hypothetical protein
MDSNATANGQLHGLIIGPLRELHADRIVVADRPLFLRNGEACRYVLGVVLEVSYTEVNGRACVNRITRR